MSRILTVKLDTTEGAFVQVMQESGFIEYPAFMYLKKEGWEFSHVDTTVTIEKGAIMTQTYPVYIASKHTLSSFLQKLQEVPKVEEPA